MNESLLRSLLERLRIGEVSVEAALHELQRPTIADLGFAQVDLDRRARCGFPEVIFGEGKTREWIESVVRRLQQAGQDCLATRLSPAQADYLSSAFPTAEVDRLGRTLWLPSCGPRPALRGKVLVVTAGTGDLPIAREAVTTAKAVGAETDLVADVGVAGIHRVLRQREKLQAADCIIVVAGMDGALPSVVGGLVDAPVIAVPTSIGYGAAFQGVAPLLTMLNCCSANVVVVNIDAGFKAGYVAALIARRAAAA